MDTFEDISAALLSHLPRIIHEGPVQLSSDRLTVNSDGVSIGDLADFIADIGGTDNFIPQGMPLRNITLRDLVLERSASGLSSFDLEFTIAWGATDLTVAGSFPLRMAQASFFWASGRLMAEADVVLQIEDMKLEAVLELPSQIVSVELSRADADLAAPYLVKRNLVQSDVAHVLRRFAVKGAIPYKHFVVRIELENLMTIGPLSLTQASAELLMVGHGDGSRFDAAATVRIAADATTDLEINVQGGCDAHGWKLAGALDITGDNFSIGDLVTSTAKSLGQTAPTLPDVIRNLTLTHLAVAFDSHTKSFSFDCALNWRGSDAQMVVHIDKRGDALRVSGTLTLGDVVFQVVFNKGDNPVLVGTFDAAGAQGLTLDEMLGAAGVDTAQVFGPGGTGITLEAKAVGAALDANGKVLMAASVDAGIDLSRLGDLPLVGNLLPTSEPLGLSVRPYFMSQGFAAQADAKALMPDTLDLPEGDLNANFNLSAQLHLGGPALSLPDVALGGTPQTAAPPQQDTQAKPDPSAPRAGLEWTDVDKSLGPLHIARVGWALSDDKDTIDLAFDGDLKVAGLTLSMVGLGAKYAFSTQALSPHLQGLGLDFRKGPLAIGGAFLNNDGDFAGKIMIGTKQFSLSALGAFKMLDGTPSVFLFGVLGMPLGGPVFFFVNGLAAGFGIHRKIHMPAIEDVRAFPLIAAANDTAVGVPIDPDPMAQLRDLTKYVEPKLGEYFFAAGIKFNSFRLLHGNVVAIVSFGRDFEVDLVGTADFTSPPELPEGVPALAKIELDLLARFAPAEGLIAVEARLNPKSYVYGPMCHLSGGFAFYSWLKGDHAGDFVLSVGGYSKHYTPPAHYPAVPRVELNFKVSDDVFIKGDAYFAMTPSVMMAGGGLHANAEIGSLHAWADFSVDMMVRWEPFHYDAWMHIGIGAKWKCFHTSASADLHIWGPKFSGRASVDWSVFSFDVEFGPGTPNLPLPISFDKFMRSFLGYDGTAPSLDNALGIVLSAGVIGDVDGVPIVAASALEITTSSQMPLTRATLGGDVVALNGAASFGIAPMAKPHAGIVSHNITITRDADAGAHGAFEVAQQAVTSKVPTALWGRDFDADPDAKPFDAAVGVKLRPAQQVVEGQSKTFDAAEFAYIEPVPQIKAPAQRSTEGIIFRPAAPAPRQIFQMAIAQVGPKKVDVIKAVRRFMGEGTGLKKAKDTVENGTAFATNLSQAAVDEIRAELETAGAVVDTAPVGQSFAHVTPAAPEITNSGPHQIKITDIGPTRISVIKVVRSITGTGLPEAAALVDGGFSQRDIAADQVMDIVRPLRDAGATVQITAQSDDPEPPGTATNVLPLAELEALGLDTDGVMPAPLRNTRTFIALGSGAAHV